MQENEFEKQVEKMMSVFKLSPPDSVWDKVNSRVNGDKRKKRPFILFLVLSLLIAGYFMYYAAEKQNQNEKQMSSNKNNSAVNIAAPNNTSKDSGNLFMQKQLNDKEDLSLAKNTGDLKNKIKAQEKQKGVFTIKREKPDQDLSAFKTAISVAKNRNSVQEKPGALNEQKNNNAVETNNEYVHKDSATNSQQSLSNDTTNLIAQAFIQNDSLNKPNAITAIKNKNEITNEIAAKKSLQKVYKTPNWQFGFTVFLGRSNETETLIDFNKSAAQYYSNTGSVNGSNDTVFHTQKPFTSASAYQFGFIMQQKIVKNGFIVTGLNFTHLSAKADVSKQKDSLLFVANPDNINNFAINSYYRPGVSGSYKSEYNFIELPLYFQQDFLRTKRISFAYNAGLSVRQLIKSKALIYNQYSNAYYFKNELLHKTQFQFMAGLKFNVSTNKNYAFFIAPQFEYNFSGLLKNSSGNNYHLINYGLQAGFLMHKK